MLTNEQKSRLNPEQLKVAEQWESEKEQRAAILAKIPRSPENAKEILEEYSEACPDICPHERSIWSPCIACHEIEKLLHPEMYCPECDDLIDFCGCNEENG